MPISLADFSIDLSYTNVVSITPDLIAEDDTIFHNIVCINETKFFNVFPIEKNKRNGKAIRAYGLSFNKAVIDLSSGAA